LSKETEIDRLDTTRRTPNGDQTIGFIVEYEDGIQASTRVGRANIAMTDQFARTIALERQRARSMRQGKIKSVKLDPEG